jgi:beta-galactosidase GanA
MIKISYLKPDIVMTGLVFIFVLGGIAAGKQNLMPHLQKQGDATQLVVDGKPFLMLAGELGNSAASSVDNMKPIWPRLAECNLNTVLMPVYWDLIEPQEGKFDFALVDGLIRDARRNDLRLVLLWFASWKNSMACYAPYWVKADYKRFPRAQDTAGKGLEILSPFSESNCDADTRAFVALMRHIRKFDGDRRTVIMVQVENEVGMIPDARDHCSAANEQFDTPVPKELMDYLQEHKDTLVPEFNDVWKAGGFKTSGTWEEIFGSGIGTEEIFMAWFYARYINRVAAAGKAEHPLPMFVNAALIRPNYKPGQYPSAGPLPHLMDVWRAGAPQIDFLAPDIYFPNFVEWIGKFDRSGNPVFIPEVGRGSENPANAFYAIGRHNAMGFSPFAIESFIKPDFELAQAYGVLSQLAPLILENQGKGTSTGVLVDSNNPIQQIRLGDYKLNVKLDAGWGKPVTPGMLAGSIIISVGPDEYIIAGKSQVITFEPDTPGEPIAGIGLIQRGRFVKGRWVTDLWLNGDESHQGRHLRLSPERYDIQRIKLYRYR